MARIPESELERIKAEVSLVRLVEAAGIELGRHGKDMVGLCPFHDDREPSLVVSAEKNLFHCMGACQMGGSVIDWVMRAEGVSFRHAVELLRDGQAGSGEVRPVVRSSVRKLPAPVEADAADAELLGQVVGFYHEALKQSPEALAYLESRALRSSEAVDRFKLGFANRTLGYRLPDKNRKAGAEVRGRLARLGILRDSGHEHFNGSLVIPVFDGDGRVVEVYGRKINDNLRQGTPKHLYLPGPHRGCWNLDGLAASAGEVVVCESLIDALTLWCAGLRNVTAIYGTGGFGSDHLAAFRAHDVKRVLIAFDADDAGNRAAETVAGRLHAVGIETFRVVWPDGEDVNSYAAAADDPAEALASVLRHARWTGTGQAPATVPVEPEPTVVASAKPGTQTPDVESEPEVEPAPAPVGSAPSKAMRMAELADDDDDDDEHVPAAEAEPVDVAPLAEVPEPPAASPVPPLPAEAPQPEVSGDEVRFSLGDRRWRIRGLGKNTSFEVLRVNVLVARDGAGPGVGFHVDTLDLYAARARAAFVTAAAAELAVKPEVVKKDLGRVLLALEGMQEELIRQAQAPKDEAVTLTEGEAADALELLRDPRLLERVVADFAACGVVGESTNLLLGYLAAASRKLDAPLAVIVQSSSAAGKSSLMDAVLAFVPPEERVQFSAMTGQSLFYMGETDLAHKVLAIVEEEGATRAAYALKLLQSEGELSIASTGKDPQTGRLTTHEYRVAGPVMIFLTTTAIDIDDELLNRCVVLTVDEERAQTRAIHNLQRRSRTLEGMLARRERDRLVDAHRNAQRLLAPLLVVNPYADRLTFADSQTRTRRDHTKYLTLIDAVALVHQHQRERKTVTTSDGQQVSYIEATLADIAVANRLAHEVLGRSLDELPPQTRRLLLAVDELAAGRGDREGADRSEVRFTRRDVREHTGWGDTQLKVHLGRLVELEYLLVHKDGARNLFELAWDGAGRDGSLFCTGLIDTDRLAAGHGYDGDRSGGNGHRSEPDGERSPSGRPPVGAGSAPGRVGLEAANVHVNGHDDAPVSAGRPERTSGAPNNGSVVAVHVDGAEREVG